MNKKLREIPEGNKGLSKLPTDVRNKMGFMKAGGLTPAQKKQMKEHGKHHSKKHMSAMEKMMEAGKSFEKAHKAAMKKVGK